MTRTLLIVAVAVLARLGCARSPSQTAADAATAVGGTVSPSVVPKNASRQAGKLVAKIDARPECEQFKTQILEAGKGSPASGKTQMAFSQARQAAQAAGCIKSP